MRARATLDGVRCSTASDKLSENGAEGMWGVEGVIRDRIVGSRHCLSRSRPGNASTRVLLRILDFDALHSLITMLRSELNENQRELFDSSISILDKNFALPLLWVSTGSRLISDGERRSCHYGMP